MCHMVATQIEPHSQIAGTQYVMQVGNGRELLGSQSAIERIQSFHPMVLMLDVCRHEAHIGCQVLKERTGELSAEHCDTDMRVLLSQ